MAISKYAEILEARGFIQQPLHEESQAHPAGFPRFSMMSQIEMTHAVDELGITWLKQGLASLSDLGFEDISHIAQAVINLFSAIEVDGERFEIPKLQ
jgi:hypothetical protein